MSKLLSLVFGSLDQRLELFEDLPSSGYSHEGSQGTLHFRPAGQRTIPLYWERAQRLGWRFVAGESPIESANWEPGLSDRHLGTIDRLLPFRDKLTGQGTGLTRRFSIELNEQVDSSQWFQRQGLRAKRFELLEGRLFHAELPPEIFHAVDIAERLDELASLPEVLGIEPELITFPSHNSDRGGANPNQRDTTRSLSRLRAVTAPSDNIASVHQANTKGTGVDIGIVDLGFFDHEDLTFDPRSFRFDGEDVQDEGDWDDCDNNPIHGTEVAGAACGPGYGSAPDATLVAGALQLHGAFSWMSTAHVLIAMRKRLNPPAVVCGAIGPDKNLEWTAPKALIEAIAELQQAGVLLVWAVPNETGPLLSGLTDTETLLVGAINNDGSRRRCSFGSGLGIMGPGERHTPSVQGCKGVHREQIGTSMAAPWVAGVAALCIQSARRNGLTLTAAKLKARLTDTATAPLLPLVINGREIPSDEAYGAGLVSAAGAIFPPSPPTT